MQISGAAEAATSRLAAVSSVPVVTAARGLQLDSTYRRHTLSVGVLARLASASNHACTFRPLCSRQRSLQCQMRCLTRRPVSKSLLLQKTHPDVEWERLASAATHQCTLQPLYWSRQRSLQCQLRWLTPRPVLRSFQLLFTPNVDAWARLASAAEHSWTFRLTILIEW